MGNCALTVLGLAKGVTPVVSVTGKRVREHAGLRVPCGGLRLPLWLRGLVWYLEAHLFQHHRHMLLDRRGSAAQTADSSQHTHTHEA